MHNELQKQVYFVRRALTILLDFCQVVAKLLSAINYITLIGKDSGHLFHIIKRLEKW